MAVLLLVIPRHILARAPLETPEDICAKRRLLRPPPLSFSRKASPNPLLLTVKPSLTVRLPLVLFPCTPV